ncbi:MAG: hypothetical protein AAF503_14205 [Pseudomonadota bacterium]
MTNGFVEIFQMPARDALQNAARLIPAPEKTAPIDREPRGHVAGFTGKIGAGGRTRQRGA